MREKETQELKVRAKFSGLILAVVCACACAPQVENPPAPLEAGDDLYLVRGYSSEDDPCKLTGETAFTNQFLDDSADLVSCPTGYEGGQELVDSKRASVVAETGGYTLYSVPNPARLP